MSIVWFPGHMAAARKKAAETLAQADLVIEVCDARAPGASTNPMIDELRRHRQRPALKVLNKADLADPAVTAQWLRWFETQPGVKAVAVSCKKPGEAARIPKLAAALVPHRNTTEKPTRAMVMGVPNVGKSTLINALIKRRAAKVGDEPAITKSQSRYPLSETMMLIDTPGLTWPKFEHAADGYMLAVGHAIGRNAYHEEEAAEWLATLLLARYPAVLAGRYGLPVDGLDGHGVIEAVAKRRGYRARGGDLDVEKAAHTLLQDYRDGLLGRISLETPQTRSAMIAAAPGQAAAARAPEAEDDD